MPFFKRRLVLGSKEIGAGRQHPGWIHIFENPKKPVSSGSFRISSKHHQSILVYPHLRTKIVSESQLLNFS